MRTQPIRTFYTEPVERAAEISAHIKILPALQPHLYQKLAQKATELHLLGLSYTKIGKILRIDHKTVAKAIHRLSEGHPKHRPHRHL